MKIHQIKTKKQQIEQYEAECPYCNFKTLPSKSKAEIEYRINSHIKNKHPKDPLNSEEKAK